MSANEQKIIPNDHLMVAWRYLMNVSYGRGYNDHKYGRPYCPQWQGELPDVVQNYIDGWNDFDHPNGG